MTAQERYEQWLDSPALSDDERAELRSIANDPREIENRFFAPLEFGTAGLRGEMATGLRNMNRHIVRHTTQAFANLILREGRDALKKGVAVCYDCRNDSTEYARTAACVLAGNGIHVRFFDALRPTPELSFAIREYGCIAGINITASHNPKQYNGYKVYWSDGAQLPPDHADVVSQERERLPIFANSPMMDFDHGVETGAIELLGERTDKAYLAMVMCQSVNTAAVAKVAADFKVIFTPFHGTGHDLVPRALRGIGIRKLICVPEQMTIDGNFPTVKSPNPEDKEGFALAIELAKSTGASLIIGTDPDADRVGTVVRDTEGNYVCLSGNQIGVLLLDYIIKGRRAAGTLPTHPALIKTIVTTEMARVVAEENGVFCCDTFTGFKFMAEKIKQFEDSGTRQFILAFEESYGYLVGDQARDKDAVVAAMLIAEMAAHYAGEGKTLYEAMEDLYKTYGYFAESTLNLVMPGVDGLKKMAALMDSLRDKPPGKIGGTVVTALRDYLSGERIELATGKTETMELKDSNVLYFELSDGTRFIVRPSGTEPKVKVYILARGENAEDCAKKVENYSVYARSLQDM